MKKLRIIILIGIFFLSIAGNAAAYFENDHLTAVIYNKTNKLVALDLGDLSNLDMSLKNQVLAMPGTFSLNDFTDFQSFSDLNVGIYGRSQGLGWTQWFATTSPEAPLTSTTSYSSFRHAADMLSKEFSGIATSSKIISNKGDIFDAMMHSRSNHEGSYAGYNQDWYYGLGEISEEHGLDMYLYKYTNIGYEIALSKGQTGTPYQSILRFSSNGSVVLNPVPIPPAIAIFGSGILFISWVRKNNFKKSA